MSVFWDSLGFDENPRSGIARHMVALESALSGLHRVVRVPGLGARWLRPLSADVAFRRARVLWSKEPESSQGRVGGHPVFHGLANINLPLLSPKRSEWRFVVTVHDLIPLLYPRDVSWTQACRYRLTARMALGRADCIVAVSPWTADCVRRFLGEAGPKRLVVIPNGFPPYEHIHIPSQQGRKTRIVCVSRTERYKRLELFADILRYGGARVEGVLVSNEAGLVWGQRYAPDLMAQGRLRIAVKPSDESLKREIANAHVYVHPSLAEGFCLPAAEARSLGRPVVYTGGSGTESVVPVGCGIALGEHATISAWMDAIEAGRSLLESREFEEANLADHRLRPTWTQVATMLRDLYIELESHS